MPPAPRSHAHYASVRPAAVVAAMMGRAPRQPVDLQAVTRDVKTKIRRVIGELEAIELQQDVIFSSPRDVYIELDMAIHQLESCMTKMRSAWWP